MEIQAKKRKVLIVDDMPINIQVLAGALKADYHVKVATSGEKAIQIAFSEDAPDLILLDIMMPEMDGYEVLRRLKESDRTQNIPVIFVTAKGEVEDEQKGLELGAVDYIAKPFHPSIVQARVKTQMNLIHKTEMLEKMVSLDGLTHIPNRRRFDEVLEKEWRRARRNALPLTLIMCDIDYFKSVNDNYGHATGDDYLKLVAIRLESLLERGSDFVARYGGEEFAVLLPEVDAKGAVTMSEKIKTQIESLGIEHSFSPVSDRLTLSLGAATLVPTEADAVVDLVKAADKMLYDAKEAGRNQCQCIDLNAAGKGCRCCG
jgi:diguanylate cyclase (GGDEF)-like protein